MSRFKKSLIAMGVAVALMAGLALASFTGPAAPLNAHAGDRSITIRVSTGRAPEGMSVTLAYALYTKEVTIQYSGLTCWFD